MFLNVQIGQVQELDYVGNPNSFGYIYIVLCSIFLIGKGM